MNALTYAISENVKQCKFAFFFFLAQMGLIKNKRDGEASERQKAVGGTVSAKEPGPHLDPGQLPPGAKNARSLGFVSSGSLLLIVC